ncbi:Pkinase-domain-containing protein [Panus rudis PR-1116 ss-1]|nr:Pkinase-domain-containing protein [Panus rudis PR-1116 ss-1]
MGDGAFSNVYKAIDLRTGDKVAVKVVRKFELSASQAGDKHLNREFKKKPRVTERANILKEVQIMRGINHPAIVKLLSFSESEEHYFLVLELMEGGELFHQIVKLTYFSENLARHVIVQVAEGIRYLHEERGVVHRDIKPENLLFERIPIVPSKNPPPKQFDEEKEDEGEFIPGVGGGGIGKVKIADFGLSKVVWDEQTMTPCGTVGYTAPEIVKDERYSKSVDMWALGCVLYTLLCGFPPFYDESINVLTEKVARGYYTFLSPWWDTISESAKDLITHLLCVDPAQRYTIDEFLSHPWIKAGHTQPAPPTPAPAFLNNAPLDSPLLAAVRGRGEVRSPGLATLKEAFDITYAVHRMEEEGARRRAQKGGANRGALAGLNEEDGEESAEEEYLLEEVKRRYGDNAAKEIESRRNQAASPGAAGQQTQLNQAQNLPAGTGAKVTAKRALQGYQTQGHRSHGASGGFDGRAGPRDRGRTKGSVPFELDLDGATLLGRRHKRGIDQPDGKAGIAGVGTLGGSPLAQAARREQLPENPGSPMRVD